MRLIYGKSDWATRERGQENCYLVTNGLGGFSSATVIGSAARNDHSFFMAALRAPGRRYNMIHRLEEYVEWDSGEKNVISSQEYREPEKNENGHYYLSRFAFEDYPRWIYHVNGLEIVKEIAMKQGENAVAVRYLLYNRTRQAACLSVIPHLQFTGKGEKLAQEQKFLLCDGRISSAGLNLYFETDGTCDVFPGKFVEGLYYACDRCDGREYTGNTFVGHRIAKRAAAGACASLEIVYRLGEKPGRAEAAGIFAGAAAARRSLAETSGFRHEAARLLAKSAGQFLAERTSVNGKTILAGFPFFEDWGRDTMIAICGCCIATRQTETAEQILRTFAAYCREGLMPNLFPEGGNEPRYNTADAALLFINAVYLCYEKTKNVAFVREMWPVMCEIVKWYRSGTAHGIHMDEDGLILAGEGLDQVTWMDVRIGDILPTPRHGKPVEINAYWYNALCILAYFGNLTGRENGYGELAETVRKSFCEKFWNARVGCLKDVLSGSAADDQVRCNQIWAVSLPFTMLDEKREREVVDTVSEKLYTPLGLRTLEKEDPQFHGTYGGPQRERDLAYHQGTVWVFPLGAYYLAYLKTRRYSQEALGMVERGLSALEAALREGCAGQLPEIYDGENPSFSRGCFAQAWSVGEILRVYETLEAHGA